MLDSMSSRCNYPKGIISLWNCIQIADFVLYFTCRNELFQSVKIINVHSVIIHVFVKCSILTNKIMCLIYLSDCPNPEGGCTLVTSRISGTGNIITLREKRVLKQYPWGTFATNGTLFSKGHSFKTVPKWGPSCGHENGATFFFQCSSTAFNYLIRLS